MTVPLTPPTSFDFINTVVQKYYIPRDTRLNLVRTKPHINVVIDAHSVTQYDHRVGTAEINKSKTLDTSVELFRFFS